MTTPKPYHPAHHAQGSRRGAVLVLGLAGWLGWLGYQQLSPPTAAWERAPADEFSAARAMAHVDALAKAPRPIGSAAHTRARSYVVKELDKLGLEVSIQETTAIRSSSGGWATGAVVRNVVARRRGSQGGGKALLLLSHYDSRSNTPGAGDDASGVATVLETLRALRHHPPLQNDLLVLVSDAEEIGLLGAEAFADEHSWADRVGFVLNFETRGARGPSTMFETGPDNLPAVRAFATTPAPFASSFSGEVYRRMPNDSDFSVFRRRGAQGLNFAFIDGFEAYHTALDTPDRLNGASLQHHGVSALAVVLRLGHTPLPLSGSGDGVYFNPLGFRLVVYPASRALPFAVTLLALTLALSEWARRRRMVTVRGALVGLGTMVTTMGAAAAVSAGAWALFRRIASGLLDAPHGVPWDHLWIALALLLLVIATSLIMVRLGSRWASPFGLFVGALLGWALLGVGVSAPAPGASYLFAWPTAAGLVGLGVVVLRRGDFASDATPMVLLTLGGLVAAVLLGPLLYLAYLGLTLDGILPLAVLLGAALGLLALPLDLVGRSLWTPSGLAIVAMMVLAIVMIRGRQLPDADRPSVDSLLLFATETESSWTSLHERASEFTRPYLADEEPIDLPPLFGERRGLRGPAPDLGLPVPSVEIVRNEPMIGGREVELRLASNRRAPVLWLRPMPADAMRLSLVQVAGRGLGSPGSPGGAESLVFQGLPSAGIRVVVQIEGDEPMRLLVADQLWGLPVAIRPEGALATRPPTLISTTSFFGDATIAEREVEL